MTETTKNTTQIPQQDQVVHSMSWKSERAWFRVAYMVLFTLFYQIAISVVGICAVVQLVWTLLNGRPNEALLDFSKRAVAYTWELLAYITFTRDQKPFPFSAWPTNQDQ